MTSPNDTESPPTLRRNIIERLIRDQQWGALTEFVQNNPSCTLEDGYGDSRTSKFCNNWSLLHYLAFHFITEIPCELLDVVARSNPQAILQPDLAVRGYGDTPLHICARHSQTSARKMKILLQYVDNDIGRQLLIRNKFGGTVLHSAANHNAVFEVLEALLQKDPRIIKVTTHEGMHPVTALWKAYLQTIPGYMCVARVLQDTPEASDSAPVPEDGHYVRFWNKLEYLAVQQFLASSTCPQQALEVTTDEGRGIYVLHGLLQCNIDTNAIRLTLKQFPHTARVPDKDGNLPLHILVKNRPFRLKEQFIIQKTLLAYPEAATQKNHYGETPLTIAILNKIPWENGIGSIVECGNDTVCQRETTYGFLPFQLAAFVGGRVAVETTYRLLKERPDLLQI